jgi:hypothetical protein
MSEHGRPPFYETPEQFEAKVADYFDNPPTKPMRFGNDVIEVPVPTITGLALHLGFESRQSFYDYESKAGFTYTVKKARAKIEKHYEELLQTGGGAGAIFALKNFGWKDKTETDLTSNGEAVGIPLIRFVNPDKNDPL